MYTRISSARSSASRGVRCASTSAPLMKLVFLGAPGVGKGTFATRIAPMLGVPAICASPRCSLSCRVTVPRLPLRGSSHTLVRSSLSPTRPAATGDIIRAEIKAGSELGAKCKAASSSGGLVPDAIVSEMVRQRLKAPDAQRGWILDGYPRTTQQAIDLDGAQVRCVCVVWARVIGARGR